MQLIRSWGTAEGFRAALPCPGVGGPAAPSRASAEQAQPSASAVFLSSPTSGRFRAHLQPCPGGRPDVKNNLPSPHRAGSKQGLSRRGGREGCSHGGRRAAVSLGSPGSPQALPTPWWGNRERISTSIPKLMAQCLQEEGWSAAKHSNGTPDPWDGQSPPGGAAPHGADLSLSKGGSQHTQLSHLRSPRDAAVPKSSPTHNQTPLQPSLLDAQSQSPRSGTTPGLCITWILAFPPCIE